MEFTQYWARVNAWPFLIENNLEWSFEPSTLDWQELCARIKNAEKPDRAAYDLYKRNDQQTDDGMTYFGCFRFDFHTGFQGDTSVIKLHFHNRDYSGYGPLSRERQAERIKDLNNMFISIKQNYPDARVVRGGSWLYNIQAYKRLFPPSSVTNMAVEAIPFPRTSGIWGQFLNSEGEVKREMADGFLTKVNHARTIDQLLQCFDFRILYPSAKVEDFYAHFQLG